MDSNKIEVVKIPPCYSEADENERETLYMLLAQLDEEYRERANPIYQRLADIEAQYEPRYLLTPHRSEHQPTQHQEPPQEGKV